MDSIVPLLTTTEGRISRKQWWIGLLVIIAAAIVATIVLALISFGNAMLLNWGGFITSLLLLWPSYCIGVKRRHDRDNDGRDLIALIGVSVLLNLLQVLGIGVTITEVGGMMVPVPEMWLMVLQFAVLVFAVYMLVQVGFLKGTPGTQPVWPRPARCLRPEGAGHANRR